ncbi:MAG TPA: citrate/2-methylcitrate synthase [Thermoplasmata archaeon]|nr:citrate/2-methylcitrate synthase [Thermoplasmata archaeon]
MPRVARRPPPAPAVAPPSTDAGLTGVVVGRSAISWVGGESSDLVFRGFDVRELVPGVPFESVAHLLLFGDPPGSDPSPIVTTALAAARAAPSPAAAVVDSLPPTLPPLEALRTILSALGDGSFGYPPRLEDGYRLIALSPVLLARFVQRSRGLPAIAPRPELGHVANYLWMLRGREPSPREVAALEAYFDLLADHGMNASTFVLRIAISTHSDLASAATAALATLKGPLHGGAPSRVVEMLNAVGSPDAAEGWVRERLARRELLYGFGHRAYKSEDPRGLLLHAVAREVADPKRLELAETVERVGLAALRAAHPEARIFANVEFYSAVVLEAIGLRPELFTPTFALARTVGWTAHALEQAAENKLIRPDVAYVGPAKGRAWPRPRGRAVSARRRPDA